MEVISKPDLIRTAQYLSTPFEATMKILGKIKIYIIQSVSQFMSMYQADIHLRSGPENNEMRIFPYSHQLSLIAFSVTNSQNQTMLVEDDDDNGDDSCKIHLSY